jgi:predicted nucleotidyltransferase
VNVVLSGIVGSTAYGLHHAGSDIDKLAIYAAPTEAFHGLHLPTGRYATVRTTQPDLTMHEVGKFAALALGCNPTVSELMWLPADLYDVRTALGDDLIAIRAAFLSAKRVREAYLGYATEQFHRLEQRGDGSFSADTRKRTAKHARHLLRLCHQGLILYTTGQMQIRLTDADRFLEFGERVAAGDIEHARQAIADHEAAFDHTPSVLPAEPDEAPVEAWLLRVRRFYYEKAA